MLFSKIIVVNGKNKFQFFTRYRYSWDPLSLVPRPLLCFVLRFAFGIIIDSIYLPKVYTIYGIIHVRFRGDAKPSYDSEFEVYG